MEIIITEDSTLAELNEQFQSHYPFLKLQFYENNVDPEKHKEVPGEPVKNYNRTVHDLIHGRVNATLSMNGQLHVNTFEKSWFEQAGIWCQVFRRSGNVWLQTTVTDDMTLRGVNQFGIEMSQPVEKDKEQNDYQDQP